MSPRSRRAAIAVITVALAAASCSSGSPRASVVTTTTTTTTAAPATTAAAVPESTTTAPAADTTTPPSTELGAIEDLTGGVEYGPPADDRIVVTTLDGSVVLVDPDGGNELVLHDGQDGLGSFPVWAPSGERIAWSVIAPGTFGQTEFTVVTTNADGTNPATIATPFAAYYAAWDRSSSVLALLGNDPTGTATTLAIGLADRDSVATRTDIGAPTYYFSWDRHSPGLLAHTAEGVRLVAPGQQPQALNVGRGLYQVPMVTGEPGVIVFGQGGESLGVVRVGNLFTADVRNVVGYRGNAWMMMHPEGHSIAIQTTGRFTEPDPENDPVLPDELELLEPGLAIVHLETGAVTTLPIEAAVAFFWSPDGEKLLLADFEPLDGISFIQWRLWEDGELRAIGDKFTPSTMFGNRILPFFDQYGISSQIWAPDSTRFTYPGRGVGGGEGIWVYDIAADRAELIYEGGNLSFWSPT